MRLWRLNWVAGTTDHSLAGKHGSTKFRVQTVDKNRLNNCKLRLFWSSFWFQRFVSHSPCNRSLAGNLIWFLFLSPSARSATTVLARQPGRGSFRLLFGVLRQLHIQWMFYPSFDIDQKRWRRSKLKRHLSRKRDCHPSKATLKKVGRDIKPFVHELRRQSPKLLS